jgi:hypothetical protein
MARKGPKHVVRKKGNKNELRYWNFVAIDSIIRKQLDVNSYYNALKFVAASYPWTVWVESLAAREESRSQRE